MNSAASGKKIKAYILLTLAMASWGTLYVVCKYIFKYVTPMTVMFFRYLLASVILLLFSLKNKPDHIEKKDIKYIILFGATGYFLSTMLQLYSTNLMSSGLSSLLNSLNPIFTVVLAVPFLHEKITIPKVISVTAAIFGVYVAIGGVSGGGAIIGIIAALVAVVAWTLASFIIKKHLENYSTITVTTYGMLICFILTSPFSIYEFATNPKIELNHTSVILGILFVGIVCTVLSNIFWNKSLTLIDAGQCAIFCPLQPLISAFLGCIFLKEVVDGSFIVGGILIIGGILLCVISDNIKSNHLHAIRLQFNKFSFSSKGK